MPRTPEYWRGKAEEVRAEMESMTDADAKKMMQAVIDHCEQLAALMERIWASGVLPPDKTM